jgi:tripartite-type tricarboxylate transporter receptor subunit TctC
MPPGTPPAYVNAMRDAFAHAIADPEVAARAAKGKVPLHFVPGDEALRILEDVLKQPKGVVDQFGKYVKFGE